MTTPDVGQQAVRRLFSAAMDSGGAEGLAEEAARGLVDACDRLVADLARAWEVEPPVTSVGGFPNLPSGQALTRGFADKGRELHDILAGFQQTAHMLQAAYLAAGKRYDEAEAAARAVLDMAPESVAPQPTSGNRDGG
ncbi:hypothetical protein IU500_04770 [Nocardia terpenica]|uniref:hypothetical protein n=1 Tax=Nocardia terpenica TaxID=455432 RepID=UPI001894FF73|nr:hypothetical protein [Nocardia terpenica]MBF6060095.1 hypothetical protein [Nocardia terpenica]MBF6103355.1 hypothetical protein [Nocardia terpenica]MBF6112271.1 hypothetical protein [Nocardia terpenica]MBF6117576.1 hypothetical protein [Nocardia terpenica]MBF6153680.1 hypothetical protein [Nocardia terpenica]